MQYRSGTNPHEPTDPNTNSRCWLFLIRSADYADLPRAWEPHINFCAWITTSNPASSRHFIRGIFQTVTPRNYYTLKTRYSKKAEWIKIQLTDYRRIQEITQGELPRFSTRHWYGLQVTGPTSPVPTRPLHRIGYNIPDYPDLVEDYILLQDDIFLHGSKEAANAYRAEATDYYARMGRYAESARDYRRMQEEEGEVYVDQSDSDDEGPAFLSTR